VATWLDRCDPWQPHQVLIRSLCELVRGALRPGRVVSKLDLTGPLWAAGLMLVCGTLWLYVLTVVLSAAATVVHTGASPAAALRWAGLIWGPRVVGVALISGGLVFAMIVLLGIPRALRPGWRQHVRLLGYWVPSAAAWAMVPVGVGLLAAGEVTMEFWRPWPLLAGLPALRVFMGRAERGAWRRSGLRMVWCGALVVVWGLGCPALAKVLLPAGLEAGWWVYLR
jgi:hypothetical protein